MISFKNTYSLLPERFYERSKPARFKSPTLVCFNYDLAQELGLQVEGVSEEELALIFSGQVILPGSDPLALAYAGFQFGHPVPQLGDGRAHWLGETAGFDIQLKGSGQTPFSRGGDGRSALGPVLREYLVSEGMHALGVPTTRALCVVTTGEMVYRQEGPEPGGVFTRVASSHLRVGTFQYFAFRQDLEAIEILLDYTLKRHYPDLLVLGNSQEKALGLLKELCDRQAKLVAQWSALGFIHGVMNTDNFSVAGITIDYGPCAFMDEFSFHKVFSSIDRRGRYSFFNQVPIAQWNILRLADCLLPLIDTDKDKAVSLVGSELQEKLGQFSRYRVKSLASKIGITDYEDSDEALVMEFLNYLEKNSLDFTLSFRNLPALYGGETEGYPTGAELTSFLEKWRDRVKSVDHLNTLNPLYIPRNHQIQRSISEAYQGDYDYFHRLHSVLKNPFSFQEGATDFSLPPKPSERVFQTFCGT